MHPPDPECHKNSPAKIRHAILDSNRVQVLRQDGKPALAIKQYLPKPWTAKMAKYTLLRKLGFQVPVEYRPPSQRREFERQCLRLWREKGFEVPGERPLPATLDSDRPAIALEWVQGTRLDHLLGEIPCDETDKLDVIGNVYSEMRARHCMAIFENEHRLVHYDANSRNLIIRNGRPVHIDFEMGHLTESIDYSAAREVLKLTLQLATRSGGNWFDAVIDLLVSKYAIRHILHRIIDDIYRRKLLRYHLKKDQRRKRKRPGLITKIDVAQALKRKLLPNHRDNAPAAPEGGLRQALETSWDGRFYQSLDDSDPRGRDMHHRYQVMQFPDSFKGASILDIGCNIGRICLDAKKRGATRAVGLDNRADVVEAMNGHYQAMGIEVELFAFDINEGLDALRKTIGATAFDYVFALSIWSHVDKQKLWEIINAINPAICILEDNAPSRIKSLERIRESLERNLNFSHFEFLGFTTDRGVRAVFRMTR